MNKIIFLKILFILVFSHPIFAKKQATIKINTDSNIIVSHHFNLPENEINLDTSLQNFHLYHPAYKQFETPFYFDLGNLALPTYTYNQKLKTPFGFNYQKPEYQALLFNMNNMQLYKTYNKVYSELYYTMALKTENILDAHHSQRINKNFAFDSRYRYMNADGIYQNQITKDHNLFLNTSFVSNNQRLHSSLGFLYNKLTFQENGGTTMDSIYEQNFINKNVVPVVLSSALSKVKEDAWQFSNSYDFGKKWSKKINDTLTLQHYVPYFRWQHTLEINNHYRNSKDGNFDSINYAAMPINTFGDTFNYQMVVHTVSNTLAFKILENKKIINDTSVIKRPYLVDVSIEHQLINVKNYSYKLDTFNLNFHGIIRCNPIFKNKINYNAAVDYAALGYNKNNYKIAGYLGYKIMANNFIYADITHQKMAANYSMINFSSRYFSTINTIPNSNFNQLKIGYKNINYKFNISYCYSIWSKYNYITNGFSTATINNATVSIINFEKEFVYKKIHMHNILQVNNQNQTKTIFPKWMYSGQVYYQNFAFKKAMFLQIGLQLISIEKYYAPYYMPIANNFYNQNQTLISQQHQLQLFINAKIKKVRIFVKADNLLQGVDGHGTYATKYYPIPDRSVKFGISWRFLD